MEGQKLKKKEKRRQEGEDAAAVFKETSPGIGCFTLKCAVGLCAARNPPNPPSITAMFAHYVFMG